MTTLVVSPEDWSGAGLDLAADAFHHLFRVRRLRVGDQIRVVDGAGRARLGVVERVERDSARLALGESLPANEPELHTELLVATPRPQRAAWLVEKATEIGISAVRFINTGRSPRQYGSSTVRRLERMARAAVEQSERARVPEITAGHAWTEVAELIGRLESCWAFDPSKTVCRLELARANSVGLVVGPEGGWEDEELALLSELGCTLTGLGQRILRIETAAIVAAGLLLVTPSVDTL